MPSAAITTRRLALSRSEAERITNEEPQDDLLDRAATLRRVTIPDWLVKAHHEHNVTPDPHQRVAAFRRLAIVTSALATVAVLAAGVLGVLLWQQQRPPAEPPVLAARPESVAAEPTPPEAAPAVVAPAEDSELDSEPAETIEPKTTKATAAPGAIHVGTTSSYPITVFLDGKMTGRLPLKLYNLSPGKHAVEFRGKGMRSQSRAFELAAGEVLDFGQVVLKPFTVAFTLDLVGEATLVTENQGRQQRVLQGPWPMKRELGLGTFTFVIVRPTIGPQTRIIVVTEETKAQTLRFEP